MTPYKFRPGLPKDPTLTGLTDIDGLTTVIALVEPCQRTEDLDTGVTVTVLRVDRIEQVAGRDAQLVRDLLRRYREERTGTQSLALVDPTTGEVA